MAFGAFAECCALGSRPRGCLLLTAARLQKFGSSLRVSTPRTERAFLLCLEGGPAAEDPAPKSDERLEAYLEEPSLRFAGLRTPPAAFAPACHAACSTCKSQRIQRTTR